MLYDTDSFLRGLDNGNRRGHTRSRTQGKRKMIGAFLLGVLVGAVALAEVTAFLVH